MDLIRTAVSNHILNLCLITWFAAQLGKVVITYVNTKKFRVDRFYGSGGMPSAHTATVCALMMGTVRVSGYASAEFAISTILAVIVIYDALGVRRAAGRHANLINKMLDIDKIADAVFDDDELSSDERAKEMKKLNESLGHKPHEVLVGALLAIVISMVYNYFVYLR